METIFGSMIVISFGSVIFTVIESLGLKTKVSEEFSFIKIPAIYKSRKWIITMIVVQILFSIFNMLYIINFILITNEKYNFFIFKIPQNVNFIYIIAIFIVSMFMMLSVIWKDFVYNKNLLEFKDTIKKRLFSIFERTENASEEFTRVENLVKCLKTTKETKKIIELYIEAKNSLNDAKENIFEIVKNKGRIEDVDLIEYKFKKTFEASDVLLKELKKNMDL